MGRRKGGKEVEYTLVQIGTWEDSNYVRI